MAGPLGETPTRFLGAQCCPVSAVRVSGSGAFLNGNPVFTGPGRTAGSGRIQNEGSAPRKGLGNEVGGGVCRLFENSTVCLLVNAKFLSLWHGWPGCPSGWLGWLCLGFLWLISEDDVIFRVDASFVNPVGVRFVWIVHCWVLSWLRTNAGGVLNTCKSNDDAQLAGRISGERVSNT